MNKSRRFILLHPSWFILMNTMCLVQIRLITMTNYFSIYVWYTCPPSYYSMDYYISYKFVVLITLWRPDYKIVSHTSVVINWNLYLANLLKNSEWEKYLSNILTKTQLEKIILAYFSIFFQCVNWEFKIFRHILYRSKFLAYIFQRSAKNAKFLPIWSLIRWSGKISTVLDRAANFPPIC